MLKKIILPLLVILFSSHSFAAGENNLVWIPYSGGILESICRNLWTDYDKTFNTTTEILVKQGNDGIVALSDLTSRASPARKFMCITNTTVLYTPLLYPDVDTKINKIEVLMQLVRTPTVWYVPNTNKLTTLKELVAYFKSLNRPINVGTFTGTGKTTAKYFASHYDLKINIINFKNGPQIYPTLYDGSIDLAIGGAGLIPVAESGRFRVFGYAADDQYDKLNKYPNFSKENSTFLKIQAWFGIAVPKGLDNCEKELIVRQLLSIVKQNKFELQAKEQYGTASGLHQPELNQTLAEEYLIIQKYYQ